MKIEENHENLDVCLESTLKKNILLGSFDQKNSITEGLYLVKRSEK